MFWIRRSDGVYLNLEKCDSIYVIEWLGEYAIAANMPGVDQTEDGEFILEDKFQTQEEAQQYLDEIINRFQDD